MIPLKDIDDLLRMSAMGTSFFYLAFTGTLLFVPPLVILATFIADYWACHKRRLTRISLYILFCVVLLPLAFVASPLTWGYTPPNYLYLIYATFFILCQMIYELFLVSKERRWTKALVKSILTPIIGTLTAIIIITLIGPIVGQAKIAAKKNVEREAAQNEMESLISQLQSPSSDTISLHIKLIQKFGTKYPNWQMSKSLALPADLSRLRNAITSDSEKIDIIDRLFIYHLPRGYDPTIEITGILIDVASSHAESIQVRRAAFHQISERYFMPTFWYSRHNEYKLFVTKCSKLATNHSLIAGEQDFILDKIQYVPRFFANPSYQNALKMHGASDTDIIEMKEKFMAFRKIVSHDA